MLNLAEETGLGTGVKVPAAGIPSYGGGLRTWILLFSMEDVRLFLKVVPGATVN